MEKTLSCHFHYLSKNKSKFLKKCPKNLFIAVVFFLAPVTTFLGGVVPGGSISAARFGRK